MLIPRTLVGAMLLLPLMVKADSTDPFELSLQELMGVEVTSVSKRSQSQFTVPAAVHVITGEHIRRSGATSLGEALLGTPGLQVARTDNNEWAISGRGFNGTFANKMLVLVDGRTVYDPTFAGVLWHNQEFVMSDIERIEVIRGPGAAMWGSNAVNAVINIITKHTSETQGTKVASSVGELQKMVSLSHGGLLGEDSSFRAYAKFAERDSYESMFFSDDERVARNNKIGVRIDSQLSNKDTLMFSADLLKRTNKGEVAERDPVLQTATSLDEDGRTQQANIAAKWSHRKTEDSEHELMFYFSQDDNDSLTRIVAEVDTYDLTYQHTWSWRPGQTLVWGAGYRHVDFDSTAEVSSALTPSSGTENNTSFFLQNESSFADGRVSLSYGIRGEDTERGGFDLQPNARVSWNVVEHLVAWGSLAQAVRTPSTSETTITATGFSIPPGSLPPLPVPVTGVFTGSQDLESEELNAIDYGLRWHASENLSIDLAGYVYDYDEIILVEFADLQCASGASFFLDPSCLATSPFLVAINQIVNNGGAKSKGGELTLNWQVSESLSFELNHTYLDLDVKGTSEASRFFATRLSGANPEQQSALTWRYAPLKNWRFDGQIRYVSELTVPAVDSYTVADFRLAWKPRPDMQIALVGRDLGKSRHLEFADNFDTRLPVEVESTFLLQFDFSL